jgi:hypothetical protein
LVKEPIAHREAFLYVPFTAMLTVEKCQYDPVMADFYDEYPELFSRAHKDWEFLVLTTFLIHQKALGDKSFWKPWIDQMPKVTFYCQQDDETIAASLDP